MNVDVNGIVRARTASTRTHGERAVHSSRGGCKRLASVDRGPAGQLTASRPDRYPNQDQPDARGVARDPHPRTSQRSIP